MQNVPTFQKCPRFATRMQILVPYLWHRHALRFSLVSDESLSLSLFIYVTAGRESKVIPPFFAL